MAKIFAGELGNEPKSQSKWKGNKTVKKILNSYKGQFATNSLDLFCVLMGEEIIFQIFLASFSHTSDKTAKEVIHW